MLYKHDPRNRRIGEGHTLFKWLETALKTRPTASTGFVSSSPRTVVSESDDEYPDSFTGLNDTPTSYAGFANYAVTVNSAENALEFTAMASGSSFVGLSDTPAGYGTSGQVPKTDGSTALTWDWVGWSELTGVPATFPPSAHTHAFIDLSDTPAGYSNTRFAKSTASGLVWADVDWSDLTGVPSTFTPSAHTHTWSDLTDALFSLNAAVAPFVVYETLGTRDLAVGGSSATADLYFDINSTNPSIWFRGTKNTAYPIGLEVSPSRFRFSTSTYVGVDRNTGPSSTTTYALRLGMEHTDNSVAGPEYTTLSEAFRQFTTGGPYTFTAATKTAEHALWMTLNPGSTIVNAASLANVQSRLDLPVTIGRVNKRPAVGDDGLVHYQAKYNDGVGFNDQTVWDVESHGIMRDNFGQWAVPLSFAAPGTADSWMFVPGNGCRSQDNNNPIGLAGNVMTGTATIGGKSTSVRIYVQPHFNPATAGAGLVGGNVTYLVVDATSCSEMVGIPHHYDNLGVMLFALSLVTSDTPQVSILMRREYNAIA